MRFFAAPPSSAATQLDAAQNGHVWAGGRESVWLGDRCPSHRMTAGNCWLDGGLGYWDGEQWRVFNLDNSPIEDQYIYAVHVADDGRVWFALNDGLAAGYGIGVYDPLDENWTFYEMSTLPIRATS